MIKKILKHLNPIYRYPSIFITNRGDDIYRLVINYRQVNSIKVNITRKEMRYILHKLLFHEINVSFRFYDNQ